MRHDKLFQRASRAAAVGWLAGAVLLARLAARAGAMWQLVDSARLAWALVVVAVALAAWLALRPGRLPAWLSVALAGIVGALGGWLGRDQSVLQPYALAVVAAAIVLAIIGLVVARWAEAPLVARRRPWVHPPQTHQG